MNGWKRELVRNFAVMTAAQLRAARALLNISKPQLAEITGVSTATLQRMENQSGELEGLAGNIRKIKTALEERGVVFVEGGAILKRLNQ